MSEQPPAQPGLRGRHRGRRGRRGAGHRPRRLRRPAARPPGPGPHPEGRPAQAVGHQAGRPVPGLRAARRASARFSLAADYLVMAAWLAYLKSRLLLPKPERPRADEPPAEELAAQLAFRLAKLDAMRQAGRGAEGPAPSSSRDVFGRGDPEAIQVIPSTRLRRRPLWPDAAPMSTSAPQEHGRRYTPAPPTGLSAGGRPRPAARHAARRWSAWTRWPACAPAAARATGPAAPPTWPRPSRPAWSWSRKARWRPASSRPSPTSICARGGEAEAGGRHERPARQRADGRGPAVRRGRRPLSARRPGQRAARGADVEPGPGGACRRRYAGAGRRAGLRRRPLALPDRRRTWPS